MRRKYVVKVAKALHPIDAAALAQTQEWCRLLRDEGPDVLLSMWSCEEWPTRKSLREVRHEVLTYLGNQKHRMGYPTYEANGWYIGSGAAESGCKTVGQRLKGTGMRGSEEGGHVVCHMRALYRCETGQWEAFWHRSTHT